MNKLEAEIRKESVKMLFNYDIKFERGEIAVSKKVNFSIGVIVKEPAEFHEYELLLLSQLKDIEAPILFRHHKVCIQIKVVAKASAELKVDGDQEYDEESRESKEVKELKEENEEDEVRISIILTKDKKGTF